jgi:tetratricopeptide (TPR) repeat protein
MLKNMEKKQRFRRTTVTVCFAALLLFVQCAYLNTFYNAQIAFNSAYKEHLKFLKTRPDTSTAVPDKVLSNYERAIQKSIKTIDIYPKSQKWHDDAVFLMGKASFYKNDFDDAIRRMRRLQREFPESPFVPESYLYLGKAYLGNQNLVKAEETFTLILEKYPWLNSNEEITLLLAQVAIGRQGKSLAVELLEKTLQSVKSIDKKMEICIQIARLYFDLKQYDKAIGTLRNAPRIKELPHLLYQIDFTLLLCYIEKRDLTGAMAVAEMMQKNKQYVKYSAEILLEQGIVFTMRKEYDKAITVFDRIVKDETGAKQARGRAWYELGLIHQHIKCNFEKARECFQQALSLSTDPEILRVAGERVQAIGTIKTIREAAISSPPPNPDTLGVVVKSLFKQGELFWLSLDEPDSALVYFRRVAADTNADSTMSVKGLYAQGWILLHLKQDTVASDSIFNQIIKTQGASLYAQKSQKEMGLTVTILTRSDSAQQAFIQAEALYFDNNDALAASNAYLKVFREYRDFPDLAARSLYAAAWLCDHAMVKKKVSAQKLYTMVCDSFPESDFCVKEARPRVKIAHDSLIVFESRRPKNIKKAVVDIREAENGDDSISAAATAPAPIEPILSDTTIVDSVLVESKIDTAQTEARDSLVPALGKPVDSLSNQPLQRRKRR